MNVMDASVYTLSQAFHDNGYTTGFFGKWHTGEAHPLLPDDFGFDRYAIVGSEVMDAGCRTESGKTELKGYREEAMFDLALDFIESKRDEVFFTYIATRVAHDRPSPMCPPEYKNMYADPGEKNNLKEQYSQWWDEILQDNVGLTADLPERFHADPGFRAKLKK